MLDGTGWSFITCITAGIAVKTILPKILVCDVELSAFQFTIEIEELAAYFIYNEGANEIEYDPLDKNLSPVIQHSGESKIFIKLIDE